MPRALLLALSRAPRLQKKLCCPPRFPLLLSQQQAALSIGRITMQVLAAQSENVAPGAATGMEPPAKQARLAAAVEESFRVQRISDKATLPKRGSAKAAGYDIASAVDTVVPARGKVCISTGLKIAVPAGTYGRVAPRSGLAAKHFIDTGAGVVDEDYRGELLVLLFNHSDVDFPVKVGDRIAQLVLERIATPEVEEVASLEETDRGAGGFGSTGIAKPL